MRFGYVASLPATVLSVPAFDFFFTEPYFSLSVEDKRFFVTFVVMAVVAAIISNQTEGIRRREERTARLYAMSRELSAAPTAQDVAAVACRHLEDVFAGEAWLLFADGGGGVQPAEGAPRGILAIAKDDAAARRLPARRRRRHARGRRVWYAPLHAATGALGVLVLRPRGRRAGTAASHDFFDAFKLARSRSRSSSARFAEQTQKAQIAVQNERLRNALLSSVSHDSSHAAGGHQGRGHRDPGAGGRDLGAAAPPAHRDHFSRGDAPQPPPSQPPRRDVPRGRGDAHPQGLAPGRGDHRHRPQPPRRAARGPPRRGDHRPDAELAQFDATLVVQVLINLVENAAKYAPPPSRILVTVERAGDAIAVEVADDGPGVPESQREKIFEKFHRASKGGTGMGLGLTICRGIVGAHGGRIWCERRPEGGASFRFTLPLDGAPPAMRPLPEVAEEA